jgi:hypothetical protein
VTLGADDVQAAGLASPARAAPAIRAQGWRCALRSASSMLWPSAARRLDLGFSTLPPSTMSVPRPAMLVAMVITPGRPAWATISASRACCLALSTWCGSFSFVSMPDSSSEFSIEVVPTSTGWPRSWQSLMSAMMARASPAHRAIHLVVRSLRIIGLDGRDDHRFQTVDLVELVGFGVGRAGHAGQLAVHAEVVLEGDRGERLVLGLDLHAFLGLDGLVQAVGPAPAGHQAAGEFVDDDHFAVLHDVVLVAVEQIVGAQAA